MAHRGLICWIAGLAAIACGAVAVAGAPNKTETKMKPPVVIAPLAADVVAEAVRAEQDAVLRRLDVCDRLRKLGEETNNPRLLQEADELQKQVSAVYAARVARLGVKGPKEDRSSPQPIRAASVVPAEPVSMGGVK